MQLMRQRSERERLMLHYLCESVIGSNETLSSFSSRTAPVAVNVTSLVRSRVVFKFLNYVTDKIFRVVLTTLALMLRCVQTICVSVRERPRARERRLCASVHNKT